MDKSVSPKDLLLHGFKKPNSNHDFLTHLFPEIYMVFEIGLGSPSSKITTLDVNYQLRTFKVKWLGVKTYEEIGHQHLAYFVRQELRDFVKSFYIVEPINPPTRYTPGKYIPRTSVQWPESKAFQKRLNDMLEELATNESLKSQQEVLIKEQMNDLKEERNSIMFSERYGYRSISFEKIKETMIEANGKLKLKASRKGWHKEGMFVYYVPEAFYPATTEIGKAIADENGNVKYQAYFAFFDGDKVIAGWRPTFEDLTTEDWIFKSI